MSYDPPPPGPGQEPSGQGGQEGYGQEGYGQQVPGHPPPGGYGQTPAQTSPLAIVSLVLGILGVPTCMFFVLGIGAVATGFVARKQVEESQGRLKGSGMAVAGLTLGLVCIVVAAAVWILVATTGEFNFTVDNT